MNFFLLIFKVDDLNVFVSKMYNIIRVILFFYVKEKVHKNETLEKSISVVSVC